MPKVFFYLNTPFISLNSCWNSSDEGQTGDRCVSVGIGDRLAGVLD